MPPASQNPSPMHDSARAHRRNNGAPPPGRRFSVEGGLPRPAEVFVPEGTRASADLLLHFHGASAVVEYAAFSADPSCAAVSVNLGAGSAVYQEALQRPGAVDRFVEALYGALGQQPSLWLSGFSAGYGAVGALLDAGVNPAGVLLLDGLHAGYAGPRPAAADGVVEEEYLETFLPYARQAAEGRAAFFFSHSAVFPGTYASTTECADWLLQRLGLKRRATLRWGPLGMQQVSVAEQGGFRVEGFAGNTAPDHMDHLHALYRFFAGLRRAAAA